ncbi:hypothetical protein XELAEV_18046123mg [Xenopus laevis]|uniref:Fat storage-inducing transmembrane protein 2 n=1 Tax=Xenopus laevis TaxID=8355 RepID=A0A974BSK8_XENLA|nr:hypothetical protein XELAEV_18046123mg [Xenopus laevis]
MEWLENCAQMFQRKILNEAFRRHCPSLLACIALGGSLLKELSPLPDSYWNNRRNVLNVYFVKFSWGWTLWLLLPFIALTNYKLTRSITKVLRRLSTLLVGTLIWYLCTNLFLYIEHITGSCFESEALLDPREHQDRRECQLHGGFWSCFDISGHCFLLSYCILIILEETSVIRSIPFERHWHRMAINGYIFQKVMGTAFGMLAWYITYRWWYLKPISPGLPPAGASHSEKEPVYKN